MRQGHYHLVGVAGVGMSAIAQALVHAGYDVSGSDRDVDAGRQLPILDQLARSGIRLVPQDGQAIQAETEALVVSTAIEADNPDVLAAASLSVPQRHRSDILWMLAKTKRCIAVAGTSGKSTVTAMIGHILTETGYDPLVINGAPLLNWRTADCVGNVRAGQGAFSVIEADESDRSLLRFSPQRAVITNASADHFDLAETESIFETFTEQVSEDVVAAWRTPERFAPSDVRCSADGLQFNYAGQAVSMPVMGEHNALNAALAMETCMRMGVTAKAVAQALMLFRGVHRRLERVGAGDGVTVFDDYSHNPAKIAAACSALLPHFDALHVIWRPHGYGPLRVMGDALAETFGSLLRSDDHLQVLPVYDVGGTADRSVTHLDFVATCERLRVPVTVSDDYDVVCAQLSAQTRPGHAVLVMGARDPYLPDLAKRIVATCSARSAS